MLAALVAVVVAGSRGTITRTSGIILLASYPAFIAVVLFTT